MDLTDREIALKRLTAAEEVLARSRRDTSRQREIVATLESAGQDTSEARELLATFEETQANREQVLAMLLHDLAQRGWKLGFP